MESVQDRVVMSKSVGSTPVKIDAGVGMPPTSSLLAVMGAGRGP